MSASDRQQRWPRYADQARRRTAETAEDYAELLRRVLALCRQAQQANDKNNPTLVDDLLNIIQRDVALAVAAFADIQRWMVEARRGKAPPCGPPASGGNEGGEE